MNKKNLIFCVVIFGLYAIIAPNKVYAQEASIPVKPAPYEYTISITPQALLSSSLRLDLEKRLRNPSHWLRLGVTGYVFPDGNFVYEPDLFLMFRGGQSFESMGGVGVEIGYKYVFPFDGERVYVSAGLLQDYFSFRYHGWEFSSFKEDGLTYWENNYGKLSQDIYRLGGNLCLGVQTYSHKALYVDGFAGVGYRYAFFKHENRRRFDANIFSPGHRGFTFTAGLRIGVRW